LRLFVFLLTPVNDFFPHNLLPPHPTPCTISTLSGKGGDVEADVAYNDGLFRQHDATFTTLEQWRSYKG
jgi:hypothetical protein